MVRGVIIAAIAIVGFLGCPREIHGQEYEDYYGDYFYPQGGKNEPKLVSSWRLSEIENATQFTVIRLIEKENGMMSKNMDAASEKCVELSAVLQEKCTKCGDAGKPKLITSVIKVAKKLAKLHPIYWKIQVGKKIIKGLKRLNLKKIMKSVGKKIKGLGKTIGKAWRRVTRSVRKVVRNIRRIVRVRLPRIRLPRVRVRLPRIRTPRIRVRFGRRRWGKKKKRSSCSNCQKMDGLSEDDLVKTLCPFLLEVNSKSLETDKFLGKIVTDVEDGFPVLEKVLHHHYLGSDEAEITIASKKGRHTYRLKNFSSLSSQQVGRAVGRYIFNRAKPKQ